MSIPQQSLPSATLSREEVARIEVGHTNISPALARGLAICFVIAIALVPLIELTGLIARGGGGPETAWAHLTRLPAQLHAPPQPPAGAGAWWRLVSANRQVLGALSAFELALDDESVIGRTLRQPAQVLMTGVLGAGNERAYPGRDGWLLYRPDVEYVTGPGFLDPAQLRRRVAAAAEWDAPPQPDPRPALVRFHQDLQARGITLIVMPTPVKPGVHPEALSARVDPDAGVLQNRSYGALVEALRRDGVLVFDPSDVFASSTGDPQYLLTDTHWRPETMEAVAERLRTFISNHVELPDADRTGYRVERLAVSNLGDTTRMLDLPERSTLYPPEEVWLHRVLLADGSPWRSTRGADVLLLGDSFSNIYSLESMGWGTSAGFAEQVSYALGRPLDRIVQNDEGAFATRAMLQADPARLQGTRVVIYQFAARELAFGDWRVY
jgi:hypothetical protein